MNTWIEQQQWPSEVKFKFRGNDEDQEKFGNFLVKAMIASVFMIFMILIVQYNSFYHVLITLSTVIMSTVGVLLGMLVTGQISTTMTGTGVIALIGVVVSHSIVLIDTFHRLRDAGQNGIEAAIRTCSSACGPYC